MRPPDHMPCSPEEAMVATLGKEIVRKVNNSCCPWREPSQGRWFRADQLARYGASFWKPVPTPPEGTRELPEEEMGNEMFMGYMLTDKGAWYGPDKWVTSVASSNGTEPWRCRVPIEKKVVAWIAFDGNEPDRACYAAYFDTQERRDRAVRDANERANKENN